MKTFSKLILLSFLGLILAVYYIINDRQTSPVKITPMVKVQAPYPYFIYATGVVETQSTNIPIGTAVPGIVTKLFVQVGQEINIGDALLSIDPRDTQEKIKLAMAEIKVADVTLTKTLHQYQINKALHDQAPKVISQKKYLSSVDDLAIANANLALTKAKLIALEKELERHTVYSPITGKVLQSKIRVGEYIDSCCTTSKSIVVGSNQLNLRVDINENDLLRLRTKAQAMAFIRNQPELKIPLDYQYTEPSIVPKTALTGSSTERTDLRVLQVIYHFDRPLFPIYVGQQLDVFIEVPAKDS